MQLDEFGGEYKWGQQQQLVFGPFCGYHVAVDVREVGLIGGKFQASYLVCQEPTTDPALIRARGKSVDRVTDSMEAAFEAAVEAAQVHMGAQLGPFLARTPMSIASVSRRGASAG